MSGRRGGDRLRRLYRGRGNERDRDEGCLMGRGPRLVLMAWSIPCIKKKKWGKGLESKLTDKIPRIKKSGGMGWNLN